LDGGDGLPATLIVCAKLLLNAMFAAESADPILLDRVLGSEVNESSDARAVANPCFRGGSKSVALATNIAAAGQEY